MKDSQERMMAHSEVKVQLLKLYLEKYLNILSTSKHFGDIHVYDLFCGEGIYDNNRKGSPLIILETVKNVYYKSKASGNTKDKFNCLFNDIESWKIDKVKGAVANKNLHYSEMGTLTFSNEDYRSLLPKVESELNKFVKQKGFIFIDPYGYKDIKVSDIKKLLSSGKAEVLLFLPTQFMFRFEEKGTPVCLVEFINELMPKNEWPSSETGIDFIENLTEAFRKNFTEDFVDSFIITRDRNQFFCLFFFTSHIYGFEKMLESKWQIDEQEGRGWQEEPSPTLFNQVDSKPNTFKLERKLTDFLKEKHSNSELYKFTLHNGFLPAHTNKLLLSLQEKGRLKVLNPDGTPARKSSFYLNYKCFKNEPEKVSIQIINKVTNGTIKY